MAQRDGTLDCNKLTSLSDADAETFARFEGSLLLNGLTSLSDAQHSSLSAGPGQAKAVFIKPWHQHGR